MERTETLIKTVETFGTHNYRPLPVVLSKGKGGKVWDVEGKEYLDFLACYSALNFGHQHPVLLNALKSQAEKLAVCSRAFHSEELCLFSEELARFCGLDMVLTMNSGTEAVESALKIARKWGYDRKKVPAGQAKIIAMKNNFHGRTISIITFSSDDLYRSGFGPYTPGFSQVPFGDLQSLEKEIDEQTVAVILEPIQAEAGVLIPPAGYLKQVRELCTRKNVLFILDEIQTGLARTGRDFCFQHEDAKPDLLILGKSLGGGLLPLSAVVGKREAMEVLHPGQHGSTFGGNPLACAVGRQALRLLNEEKLSERAARLGKVAMEQLTRESLPKVREIRGRGLLIGIELDASSGGARKYCERLAARGVLCKETHDFVIRVAPPLILEEAELKRGLDIVIDIIKK